MDPLSQNPCGGKLMIAYYIILDKLIAYQFIIKRYNLNHTWLDTAGMRNRGEGEAEQPLELSPVRCELWPFDVAINDTQPPYFKEIIRAIYELIVLLL